jgi:L-asparaginase
MMHIKIFTTGGTIDKVYFDATSEYQVGPANISAVFDELKLGFNYTVDSLMKKDSLDLIDDDREAIYQAAVKDPADRILITHGTDTMVQTAKKLATIQGKTIVLTGALKPALFKTTDAIFNIGCAVIAVQTLQPGVYIVMNGCVFTHDQVRKNVQQGKFETLQSSEQ